MNADNFPEKENFAAASMAVIFRIAATWWSKYELIKKAARDVGHHYVCYNPVI